MRQRCVPRQSQIAEPTSPKRAAMAILIVTIILGVARPSYAEYPAGCAELQDCVDSAISSILNSCQSANPSCDVNSFTTNKSVERFAATSGEIAERAIALKKCSEKSTRQSCNACYQSAKAPLRNRFFGKIFRGLLANSIQLIDAERVRVCSAL